jgi:hypothetical protein
MTQRGRISAAALSVVADIQHMPRPEPPAELSDEEAAVWKEISQSLPADWIKTYAKHLFVELVAHVIEARHIRQWMRAAKEDPDLGVATYDRLLKMHERESRAIASLSVKLRLSPSSEYRKETKKDTIGDRAWSIRNPRRSGDKMD